MSENVEVANSRGIAKHARFGGMVGSYRIFKAGITASQAAPAADSRLGTVVGDRFELCKWVVKIDTFTSAHVHFLRWVACLDDQGNVVPNGTGSWVEESWSPKVITDDAAFDQPVDGDILCVYVDNLVGAGSAKVLRKGFNRRS